MTKRTFLVDRRALIKQTAGVAAGALAAPMIGRTEANTIKIGMQTILSGRFAQLGTSSRNGNARSRKDQRIWWPRWPHD
jgi:hypothetical protein